MNRWFVAVLGACLVSLVIFAGCPSKEVDESTVAWVNEEAIPFTVFWEEIKSRYNEAADPSLPEQEVLRSLKKEVLSDLIREVLLLQEASRRGISISERAVQTREEAVKEGYSGNEFRKSLITQSKDYGPWREALRRNLVLDALFRQVVEEAEPVTDEEISDYYDKHQDEFLVPETLQLSQIVVKERSLAEKIRKKVGKGQDFGALAKEYSIGPEKDRQGNLGAFQKGELPEVLEEVAFAAPTGKATSVVKTDYGYHLLKVEKRIPAHMASLEDVRDRIARELEQTRQDEYYSRWVDDLIKRSDIRVRASLRDLVSYR